MRHFNFNTYCETNFYMRLTGRSNPGICTHLYPIQIVFNCWFKYVVALFFIFIPWTYISAQGDSLKIWAASDGIKIDKYNLNHPFKPGNLIWDGDTIRIFGAQNEIVAFQIIIETSTSPITIFKVRLEKLTHAQR